MAKWSESDIYQQTRGTNRFTRFVGWLNNLMNPNHSWVSDWQQFSRDVSPSEDIINQVTKQALTGAEREANAFSAQQAQEQRNWEERMSNTAYQRQVADMRAAGVNPALMMNGGSSGASTPSGSAASSVAPSGSGVSMSDIMQLMLLPMNKKILEAQASNIVADTDKKRAETEESSQRVEQLKLINKYYPGVTEAQLSEIASRVGLNMADIDKRSLESAILLIERDIKSAESKYADKYYKARAEYEEAHTQEAKDNAAAAAARAAWDIFETNWTREHNGARPTASGVLALISFLTSRVGINDDGTIDDGENSTIIRTVKDAVDAAGDVLTDPVGTGREAGAKSREKSGSVGSRLREKWDRFERWRNKPKRIF